MTTSMQNASVKTSYFSLRQYDPDQVQRVNLSPQYSQTPLKYATKIKTFFELKNEFPVLLFFEYDKQTKN